MTAARIRAVAALLAGLVFGLGLGLSGMTRPSKVIGFLDVAGGRWDPSLAFVMVGAIGVHALAVRFARRRAHPFGDEAFAWPTPRDVDGRLVGGAAIFGIGWGVAGACPGPAIVAAASGSLPLVVFVAAMIGGMALAKKRG